ncbi:hypothetical protein [Halobacteriovorax marinus]|uniref:hypothetical protein n=1 Tax=Halobacteriovorax marinus TaxID=97084 RepID=UPI0012FEB5D7|nr:hypothetical protein [Halobacteriovorax marinus]
MQSRIRKKRCTQRAKWLRKASLACVSVALLSCTHTSLNSKNDFELMTNQLGNLCLSSQGRGRIKLLKSTTLFSYESANDASRKIWKMGVDIPLHGSELLSLYWGEIENSVARFKGNFARRIYTTIRNQNNSKENISYLKGFAHGFSQLIFLSEKLNKEGKNLCQSEYCKVGDSVLSWKTSEGHLFFDYSSDGNSSEILRFDFSNLSEEGAKRLSIYPIENKSSSNSFRVELFFNQCE